MARQQGKQQRESFKFVPNASPNTKRKPDKEWAFYKDMIVGKYEKKTLDTVIQEMKDEYNFVATRRQMVHHLEKWKAKKYKKAPQTQSSQEPAQDDVDMDKGTGANSDEGFQQEGFPGYETRGLPTTVVFRPSDGYGASGAPHPGGNTASTFSAPNLPEAGSYSEVPANLSMNWLQIPGQRIDDSRRQRQRLVGEGLFAVGDSSSFQICESLCTGSDWSQMTDTQRESLVHDLITCLRSAHTKDQAKGARDLLQLHVDPVLGGLAGGGDLATIIDILAAHTFDHGGDRMNAMGQIEAKLLKIVEPIDNKVFLRKLVPRSILLLDVPLFIVLSYALSHCWNDCDHVATLRAPQHDASDQLIKGRSANTQPGEPQPINTDEVLDKWINDQFDNTSPEHLTCVSDCIRFCLQALREPDEVFWADLGKTVSGIGKELQGTYQVVLYLWNFWVNEGPVHNSWATFSQTQLGLSAPEVLVTIACMIMAKTATPKSANKSPPQPSQPSDPNDSLVSSTMPKAQQGVERLINLDPKEQVRLFLRQIRRNSDKRMLALRGDSRSALVPGFDPVRHYIINTLGPVDVDTSQLDRPAKFIPLDPIVILGKVGAGQSKKEKKNASARKSQGLPNRSIATSSRDSSVLSQEQAGLTLRSEFDGQWA